VQAGRLQRPNTRAGLPYCDIASHEIFDVYELLRYIQRIQHKMASTESNLEKGPLPKHEEQWPMTNWVYDVFLWTLTILVDLFFREVHPRGSWKVPRRGPVIFVAAPHANQVCGVYSQLMVVEEERRNFMDLEGYWDGRIHGLTGLLH
jgi:hypothetical protein